MPEIHYWFGSTLRFKVGQRGNRPVYLEIPRFKFTTGAANPVKPYDPADNLLQIKAQAVGGPKKQRKAGTRYYIFFDYDNPILTSFLEKLTAEGVLEPYSTKKKWRHYPGKLHPAYLSWWTLPKTQTTSYKMDKWRKQQEKKTRQRQQQKKAGIVYSDKKRTKKADQVYLIQMGKEDVYKIGVSNAPGKRLQALNTSNPYDLRLVHSFVADPAADAEAQLHARFADQQMSGEWFRLEPEQVAEVVQIVAFEDGRFVKGVG